MPKKPKKMKKAKISEGIPPDTSRGFDTKVNHNKVNELKINKLLEQKVKLVQPKWYENKWLYFTFGVALTATSVKLAGQIVD